MHLFIGTSGKYIIGLSLFITQIFRIDDSNNKRALHRNIKSLKARLQRNGKRLCHATHSIKWFASAKHDFNVGGRIVDCLLLLGFHRIELSDFVFMGCTSAGRNVGTRFSSVSRRSSPSFLYSHLYSTPTKVPQPSKAI